MAPLASHPIFMLSGVNKLSCRFHMKITTVVLPLATTLLLFNQDDAVERENSVLSAGSLGLLKIFILLLINILQINFNHLLQAF